jgi:hypothetical protein
VGQAWRREEVVGHLKKSQEAPASEAAAAAACAAAVERPFAIPLVLFWQVVAVAAAAAGVLERAVVESQEYWMDTGGVVRGLSSAAFRTDLDNQGRRRSTLSTKAVGAVAVVTADCVEAPNQGSQGASAAGMNLDRDGVRVLPPKRALDHCPGIREECWTDSWRCCWL